MLMKICPKCGKLIDYTQHYCTECQKEYDAEKKEDYKQYKLRRADKDIQKIYVSKEWEMVKAEAKIKQRGLDLYSYYILYKIEYADLYHHIVEVKEDISRAYDIRNVIGLTDKNHKRIHKQYEKDEASKKKMQQLLFSLLIRWNKEFC